jgi:tetratricopeptide (TPR) repeat protein
MIRQYAQEKLADAGETARCRDRQRDWCIALAETAEPHLTEADPAEWLNRLDVEHDNLRAALSWCEENDPLAELRLVGSLGWFWFIRGYLAEGQKWLEASLGRVSPETPPLLRARALFHAGQLAVFHHDYAAGLRFLQDSVELSRSLGRPGDTAWALTYLGIGLTFQAGERSGERSRSVLEEAAAQFRDLRDSAGLSMALTFLALSKLLLGTEDLPSREQLEENLTIAREGGHKMTIAWALFLLGGLERVKDNFTGASARYEESLALFRDIGDRWATAVLLWNLGDLARLRGDFAEVCPRLREAIEYAQRRHETLSAFVLCTIANLAIQLGELSRGVQLHGAAVAIDAQYTRGLAAVVIADRDANLASARASLGDAAFERAWAEGLAMPRDRAIALALADM